MSATKTRILGTIRYLRPDHNPLRRPIDRAHSRIVLAIAAVALVVSPLAAIIVGGLAYDAGLRSAARQAHARHRVEATVLTAPPTPARSGVFETSTVQWRDTTGALRKDDVPRRNGDRAGVRRWIWLDAAGRPVSAPDSRAHTLGGAIAMSATALTALFLVLAATYTAAEHRLDRRRAAVWEREWLDIAPRWTGRP